MTRAQTLDGRYVLERLLGRGGMGEVYEAIHKATGRRVALKVLRTLEGDEETATDLAMRFQREARAAGTISSPHIVQVLDAGEDAETHELYMVMEYLEGEDLDVLIRKHGPLPVELAVRIAIQACMGLSKAHDLGIVHRDIKPANLHLSRAEGGRRTVKVLDFGVARMNEKTTNAEQTTSDLTQTGSMLGSPLYMSPEQARGLKSIDARADIWSLGVVLYKMLSGRTPHSKGDGGIGDLLIAICCVPSQSVQDFAPWVPPELATIVHRALRIERDQRYASVDAMLAELREFWRGGWDIDDSMIRSMTDAERAILAPRSRAVSQSCERDTDPAAMLVEGAEASTSHLVVSSHVLRTQAPKSRRFGMGFAATVGAGLSAIVAGLLLYARPPAPSERPTTAASSLSSQAATSEAHLPSPASPVEAAPTARDVTVYVTPNASVEVNGASVTRSSKDTIVLSGILGSTHIVRAYRGALETRVDVTITETGAVPPAVILTAAPAKASNTNVTARVASPARTAAPSSSPPPAPKPDSKLIDKFE